MDSNLKSKLEVLKRSEARVVISDYLRFRLAEVCGEFINCSPETFRSQQGRALELQKLIKFLNDER